MLGCAKLVFITINNQMYRVLEDTEALKHQNLIYVAENGICVIRIFSRTRSVSTETPFFTNITQSKITSYGLFRYIGERMIGRNISEYASPLI
jgi:hypothetical protein